MPDQENDEELAANMKFAARKLATLIYHSTMPDDVKDAWISVLPEMSFGQIDKLLSILEAKYLDEKTKHIDAEYKEKIEKLVSELDQEKLQEDEKFIEALKRLGE